MLRSLWRIRVRRNRTTEAGDEHHRHSLTKSHAVVIVDAPDAANRRGYLPRKPLARKAIPAEIRSLCRSYTAESIRVLASIMRQPEHSDAARIQAANILLDRGWGRAPQACADEDRNDIRITIRQFVECDDKRSTYLVQVSSQMNELDAQASYRALQQLKGLHHLQVQMLCCSR
jgi:hypothetical protein